MQLFILDDGHHCLKSSHHEQSFKEIRIISTQLNASTFLDTFSAIIEAFQNFLKLICQVFGLLLTICFSIIEEKVQGAEFKSWCAFSPYRYFKWNFYHMIMVLLSIVRLRIGKLLKILDF